MYLVGFKDYSHGIKSCIEASDKSKLPIIELEKNPTDVHEI